MHLVSEKSKLFTPSWEEAQRWCNFVLFKPSWLPEDIQETHSQMRTESPDTRASHKSEFAGNGRKFTLKQFLYDWGPPAYDHPSLWRNPRISTPENTPTPRPFLIGNNFLWIGLDHRRNPGASLNMLRTQIEMTILEGTFEDEEILQIFSSLKPVSEEIKGEVLKFSLGELCHTFRHKSATISVPLSYLRYTRREEDQGHAFSASQHEGSLPAEFLKHFEIESYRLDSIFVFGKDKAQPNEVEYYFENLQEPGAYIRILVTQDSAANPIPSPAVLADQECEYIEGTFEDGQPYYHAWSKLNDKGSHVLSFQKGSLRTMCIVKSAPWTSPLYVRDLCQRLYRGE